MVAIHHARQIAQCECGSYTCIRVTIDGQVVPRCAECVQTDLLIERWHAEALRQDEARKPWWVRLWKRIEAAMWEMEG